MNAQPPCKIIKPTFFVEPTGLECGMDFQGQPKNGNQSLGPIQREKLRRKGPKRRNAARWKLMAWLEQTWYSNFGEARGSEKTLLMNRGT